MSMSLTGTVKEIVGIQKGQGAKGPWQKQEFILTTEGDYPKDVCMEVWGDKVEGFNIRPGETLTAHIDIASREYNGRWYTDVKCWKIDRDGPPASAPAKAGGSGSDDGLPFAAMREPGQ